MCIMRGFFVRVDYASVRKNWPEVRGWVTYYYLEVPNKTYTRRILTNVPNVISCKTNLKTEHLLSNVCVCVNSSIILTYQTRCTSTKPNKTYSYTNKIIYINTTKQTLHSHAYTHSHTYNNTIYKSTLFTT